MWSQSMEYAINILYNNATQYFAQFKQAQQQELNLGAASRQNSRELNHLLKQKNAKRIKNESLEKSSD